MPIPSSINDLSTTAGSNSPPGSESPSLIDDYLRTYASYIALLRDAAQSNGFNMATAGGTANAITATYSPAVTTLSDSTVLLVKAASANTGATTFSPNGLTAKPVVGGAHAALQGGEIVANGEVCLQYNSSVGAGSWVIIYSTGAAVQVGRASQSQHAVQLSQVAGIVGHARNARMYVPSASSTGSFNADEVIVESALGGLRYCLSNFGGTINLTTNGAGGMDTGSTPSSGYVGIYAIYNPTSGATALLAVNANATVGHVYGGANMPAGYTASGLIAVLPTNVSSQIIPMLLRDRKVSFAPRTIISTNTMAASLTALNASSIVPANAVSVGGNFGLSSSVSSSLNTTLAGDAANGVDSHQYGTSGSVIVGSFEVDVTVAQFIYYQCASSAGTPTYTINIPFYRF